MDKIKEKKAEIFDLIRDRDLLNNKIAQINRVIQEKLKELRTLEESKPAK